MMLVLRPDPETRTADGTPAVKWVDAPTPVVPVYRGSMLKRGAMNDLRAGHGEPE